MVMIDSWDEGRKRSKKEIFNERATDRAIAMLEKVSGDEFCNDDQLSVFEEINEKIKNGTITNDAFPIIFNHCSGVALKYYQLNKNDKIIGAAGEVISSMAKKEESFGPAAFASLSKIIVNAPTCLYSSNLKAFSSTAKSFAKILKNDAKCYDPTLARSVLDKTEDFYAATADKSPPILVEAKATIKDAIKKTGAVYIKKHAFK